jgi:hypothetical protein
MVLKAVSYANKRGSSIQGAWSFRTFVEIIAIPA